MSVKKKIPASDLICMDDFADKYNYIVELDYAHDRNYLFNERIYRKDAQLWLYKDLAEIVFMAAQQCYQTHDYKFVLYDGLRTCDAQEAMMHTKRVKENLHWLEEPRLLSPPGSGGHPRAMAIDIGLEDKNGELLDMGCVFDYLAESPYPEHNLAHREYVHSPEIMANRKILNDCMEDAAENLAIPLLPLPQEWWDFRMPVEVYGEYLPVHEGNLPQAMRLLDI